MAGRHGHLALHPHRLRISTTSADANCAIKGNISRSGERIYHMPWDPWYGRTKLSEGKGERWFCSEQEGYGPLKGHGYTVAQKVREATVQWRDADIEPVIEFVDRLEPENIAARLKALGRDCAAVALIAADHPLIGQAIHGLKAEGKPVVAYITDQSAPERAGYVGTDNWKLGRTAAWFIATTTHGPGRVAVLIGNYRYQCQDIADASFRSYIRENAGRLTVEDSRPTHEEPREAYRIVSEPLEKLNDLVGIYIVGGGISGVLKALREAPEERRRTIRVICRDIGPETRRGLAEGLITAALCHPLEQTSSQLVQTMLDSLRQVESGVILQRTIPFEILTPESLGLSFLLSLQHQLVTSAR